MIPPMEEGTECLRMQEVPGSNAERIVGSIEFKNVSFRYNEERSIFNSLSFRIDPCEKIAIVGNSGVGKSTLVNLLCRIYDPDEWTFREGRNKELRLPGYLLRILQSWFLMSQPVHWTVGLK